MKSPYVPSVGVPVEAGGGGDVCFAADDRLHPARVKGVIHVDGTAHIAVVGHGHGAHLLLLAELQQSGRGAGSVQKAVMGVDMEVNEIVHCPRPSKTISSTPQTAKQYAA